MALCSTPASNIYRPLSATSKNIRILTLEPGPRQAALKGHLQHVSLNSAPEFEALSYMWGDPSNLRKILLSGQEWKVTVNLEKALRHLREDEPRLLWVDALCINQSDLGERRQQVGIMREIYTSAKTVIAWTGEASRDSDEAIGLIREIGCFMKLHDDGGLPAPTAITANDLRQRGFDPSTKNWGALWALFDRPYWGRVWMVQELATDDSVVIVAGSMWVLKTDYTEACTLIQALGRSAEYFDRTTGQREEPNRSLASRDVPRGMDMWNILSLCDDIDSQESLLSLMYGTMNLGASDPRDKIYAMLGLASEQMSAFPADYTKPIERVLEDLIRFLVTRNSNLLCLQGNRRSPNKFGPSWVLELNNKMPGGAAWANEDHQYRASGSRAADVVFDENRSLLHARGLMVGRLREVRGPFSSETSDPRRQDLYEHVFKLDERKRQAVWRALVMDVDLTDWDNPIFPAPQEFYNMHRVFFGLEEPPSDFEPQQRYETRCDKYGSRYQQNMDGCLVNRQFFTTDGGDVGLGPFRARVGDVVVILSGGMFCSVLRPKGDMYELIGDAYVQGAMTGELVAAAASNRVRTFTLC